MTWHSVCFFIEWICLLSSSGKFFFICHISPLSSFFQFRKGKHFTCFHHYPVGFCSGKDHSQSFYSTKFLRSFYHGESLFFLVLAWSMARSPTIALNLGRSFLRKHDLTSQQVVILTFGFYVWRWWSDSAKTPYVLSTRGQTPVSEYHNCCEHWRVATLFLFFRLGRGYFSSRCVHGDFRPKGSH